MGNKWRLPTFTELANITGQTALSTAWTTTGLTGRSLANGGVNGGWFGPGLNANAGTTNILTQVFLPRGGYRTNGTGAIVNAGTEVYYWSSESSNTTQAYALGHTASNVFQASFTRSTGRLVRCVWK